MWRKTTQARPQPASKTPMPAPVKSRETSQTAAPQSSTPAIRTPVAVPTTTTASTASVAPAPAAKPAQTAPLAASGPASSPAHSVGISTISAGLKIKGEITGTSDLTIDGETHGKVRIPNGCVTVGPNGRVIAEIDAREIVVFGTVQGNLQATESVRLGASCQVDGTVLTPRIAIDDGASLRGNVEMARPGEAPRAQTLSAHAPQLVPKQATHASQPTPSVESTGPASAATMPAAPEAAKAVSAGSASAAASTDE